MTTTTTTHEIEINGTSATIEIVRQSANGPKVVYPRHLDDDDCAVTLVDELCSAAGYRVDWSSEIRCNDPRRMAAPLVSR